MDIYTVGKRFGDIHVNFEAKVTGTTNTGGHDTDLCAEFLIDS